MSGPFSGAAYLGTRFCLWCSSSAFESRLPCGRSERFFDVYFEQRLSMRQIAQSTGVGLASVSDLIHRAEATGVLWQGALELDDAASERCSHPSLQGQ